MIVIEDANACMVAEEMFTIEEPEKIVLEVSAYDCTEGNKVVWISQ